MESWRQELYTSELYHHGILGQKWGVRRYQNEDRTWTEAGKIRYGRKATDKKSPTNNVRGDGKSSVKSRISRILNSETGSVDDLSPAIMQVGLTAVMATAMIGVRAVQKSVNMKKFDKELDDKYNNRDIKDLASAPRLSKPMPAKQSMKLVNPGYPNEGHTQNCMLCTTAMVMREKGYDVKAGTTPHGFYNQNIEKMFNGAKFKNCGGLSSSKIVKDLSKEGDGAYGNLCITWKLGGGHSIFWKNEGGQTHIYDAQSGEEYDLNKNSKFMSQINGRATYARLDNVEPNEHALAALRR